MYKVFENEYDRNFSFFFEKLARSTLMTDRLTIALAQLNPIVGKIDFNLNRLREVRARAAKAGADLVVTSELYSCGYPPEDLVR